MNLSSQWRDTCFTISPLSVVRRGEARPTSTCHLNILTMTPQTKAPLKRKSQSIIVGGDWHIIMVKNHPLGIPLQPYSISCLSFLEPFNEQFRSSRMLCMFWIICLPKTNKARYEVFRPCAKASGWMSVRASNRKIGVQNSVWHR